MISELNSRHRTWGYAFIMSRRKITKKGIFAEVVIPSPNLRCQRKQKYNNTEIIPILRSGTLDLTGSLRLALGTSHQESLESLSGVRALYSKRS